MELHTPKPNKHQMAATIHTYIIGRNNTSVKTRFLTPLVCVKQRCQKKKKTIFTLGKTTYGLTRKQMGFIEENWN